MFTTWTRKVTLLLVAIFGVIVAISTLSVTAQQNVWTENNENRAEITKDKAVARPTFPTEFKLFNLNIEPLRQQLFSIVDSNNRQHSTVISLPNADGNLEDFEVFEASNFDPELQARFPQIRAFSGKGVTDKNATLKLSIAPSGIQTMVFRSDSANEFIEPFSQDHTVYAVFGTHRQVGGLPWECSTEDKNLISDVNGKLPDAPDSNTGEARTMRLAQSCNAEYSNFFGATSAAQVDLVLAGFNGTLTRANGVYERDLALHLNLIANTTAVIYYDPATDPYTTLGSWNNQLQAALTANIGEANYDIGHMFGASGGGGNAGCIGCVCVDGQKGRGITSPADSIPMGDNFDIDYVVHEVGHQLGANHTFSHASEGFGQNKEVGSGITIMGYAGITSQDVSPHSIDPFHSTSIQQIQVNLATKACPVTTVMTANHPPVVSPVSNYTIPISTPFALTGSATDPEGDALTYQWEQNDNSTTTGAASVASPTKATGPNWLSFNPTISGTRTFPRPSTYLAGLFVTPPLAGGDAGTNIEALSSVGRTLNFRLTVRDNRPYVPASTIGQTQFTDMIVTVSAAAGPFKVTSPNTGISVLGGGTHNVTWDVAGTTGAPVSTANVKISLSTDSGNTFPTVLAASTANDGAEVVSIPAMGNTTTCRIKIEAIGNVYFDVSDTNFTITGALLAKRADFDGDGVADLSVYRNGVWNVNRSTGGPITVPFGLTTDVLVPGDYDGDAKTDYAVYRNGAWYMQRSTAGFQGLNWGTAGDVPVPGDFDGDQKTDVAVFRPSNGGWYVLRSSDGGITAQLWGVNGDRAIQGDFDADGKADLAVYRPSTFVWYVLQSTAGPTALLFGAAGDSPVPADYDGDGKTDIAVVRPSGGLFTWYLQRSTAGFTGFIWGLSTDQPSPADFDGDGKHDVAVFRAGDGSWTIQRSSNGALDIRTYGQAGDRSVPNAYLPQ
jgi:hypothetical protein